LAASVLVGAGVVFGATVVAALRVDAHLEAVGEAVTGEEPPSRLSALELGDALNPGSPGSMWGGQGSPQGALYPRVTGDEILDAVNHDPFQPSRTPSPQRYLLPSERTAATATRPDPRRRGPELRLVGSAVGAERGVAMIQVGDGAPVALVRGEFVEGYRLAAVEPDVAILEGELETLTLPLMAQLERGRASAQRGAAAPTAQGPQVNPRDMEALQNRVQELLQGLGRGGGMGPGGGMGARLQEIVEFGPNVIIRGGEGVIQLPPGVVRGGRGGGGGGLLP
jgi:hypothetical protein